MPEWKRLVRQHLARLRLPPEREMSWTGGMLHTGAAGYEGGPDGRAALRVMGINFREQYA
jgi:hypothetical protein